MVFNLGKRWPCFEQLAPGGQWWRVVACAQSTSLELRVVCSSVQHSVADYWFFVELWQHSIHLLSAPPLSIPLFHCWHTSHLWQGPSGCLYVGAHGWVSGIASHGSVFNLPSRGRLVMVKVPQHPRHPSSIQLDVVMNTSFLSWVHMHWKVYFVAEKKNLP